MYIHFKCVFAEMFFSHTGGDVELYRVLGVFRTHGLLKVWSHCWHLHHLTCPTHKTIPHVFYQDSNVVFWSGAIFTMDVQLLFSVLLRFFWASLSAGII